jgi:hypothetical protein
LAAALALFAALALPPLSAPRGAAPLPEAPPHAHFPPLLAGVPHDHGSGDLPRPLDALPACGGGAPLLSPAIAEPLCGIAPAMPAVPIFSAPPRAVAEAARFVRGPPHGAA